MPCPLEEAVVAITGASSGIGSAAALRLAHRARAALRRFREQGSGVLIGARAPCGEPSSPRPAAPFAGFSRRTFEVYRDRRQG